MYIYICQYVSISAIYWWIPISPVPKLSGSTPKTLNAQATHWRPPSGHEAQLWLRAWSDHLAPWGVNGSGKSGKYGWKMVEKWWKTMLGHGGFFVGKGMNLMSWKKVPKSHIRILPFKPTVSSSLVAGKISGLVLAFCFTGVPSLPCHDGNKSMSLFNLCRGRWYMVYSHPTIMNGIPYDE